MQNSIPFDFDWRPIAGGMLLALAGTALPSGAVSAGPSGPVQQGAKLEVCHEPPGQPVNRRVVTVGAEQALQAHLDHGDSVFGNGLGPGCEGGELTFTIDPSLEPSVPGAGDAIGVVAGPTGGVDEFMADQVQFRPSGPDELQALLDRYDGTVLRDDSVPVLRDDGSVELLSGVGGGWHLLRLDLSQSGLLDLPRLAREADIAEGDFVFSSRDSARAVALQLRELDLRVRPNFLLYPLDVREHPYGYDKDGDGVDDFIDFSDRFWMNHADPSPPELSTSTVRAWNLLRNTGLPPVATDEEWFPAEVAVVDVGFAVDPDTGLGSRDYHDCQRFGSANARCDNPLEPPLQIDLVEHDNRAGNGAFNGGWHGESMLGVCCAFPDNRFGAAGSGGEYVEPVPFNVMDTTVLGDQVINNFAVAQAIRSAAFRGMPVISMSLGGRCDWEWSVESSLCRTGTELGFMEDANLQQAVLTATSLGSVVLASAGNGLDENFDGEKYVPCKLNNVICVGGVNHLGDNVYHWGHAVDIWGPTTGASGNLGVPQLLSTITPESAATPPVDNDDTGIDELDTTGGTSAATAYVAGVAAMLKSIDPTLRWDDVQRILQETANCSFEHVGPCPNSAPQPKVRYGWVDTLRAVRRVRDATNSAPTVRIIAPADGASKSWTDASVHFTMRVEDPPNPDGFAGDVTIDSDPSRYACSTGGEGLIHSCTDGNPPVALPPGGEPVSPLGTHEVTATATDELGASGQDTIEITVTNDEPAVSLDSPPDGSVHFSDQLVAFRAAVSDGDGETFDDTCPAPGFFNACVSWTSSLDGPLEPPEGESPGDFALSLSEGVHAITVSVEDGQGATDSASVSVEVLPGEGQPSARILSTAPEFPRTGETVVLNGEGNDPEDGELSGASLEWFSDIDGFLGTGATLEVVLSGPSGEGFDYHQVSLHATDSEGNTDTDDVTIRVGNLE